MVERFLKQTHFESVEDYNKHLEFIIPENFNSAKALSELVRRLDEE